MKVDIVGGMSSVNRVTILSDEYVSTARYHEDSGEISCEIKALPPIVRFLQKNKRLPIPRLARVALPLLNMMGRKGAVLIALYFLITACIPTMFPGEMFIGISSKYFVLFDFLTIFGLLLFIKKYIGTWHGAEHKAISAYQKFESTDIQVIARENRYNAKCGGRLFFPSMLTFPMAIAMDGWLGLNMVVWSLVLLEIILWADYIWGMDKLPITSQASYLLQTYLTTVEPGRIELETAQCAMEGVLWAHADI